MVVTIWRGDFEFSAHSRWLMLPLSLGELWGVVGDSLEGLSSLQFSWPVPNDPLGLLPWCEHMEVLPPLFSLGFLGSSTKPDSGEPHAGALFGTWPISGLGNIYVSLILTISDPNTVMISGLHHQSHKADLL